MARYHLKKKTTKKAFTLVELSLVIAFLSIILIIMATLTVSLIAIYRKGMTISDVNFVGRSVIEDLQNSISEAKISQNPQAICSGKYTKGSSEYNSCEADGAMKLIYREALDASGKPLYGAFCTGAYSYIWNTGYAEKLGTSHKVQLNGSSYPRLLKVRDEQREVCKQFVNDSYNAVDPTNISIGISEDPVELISDDNNGSKLAIYHFYVSKPATIPDTGRAFFSGSFILATIEGGVEIMASGNYCKPPGSASSDENFNYCAINKFNFAVQGNGGI